MADYIAELDTWFDITPTFKRVELFITQIFDRNVEVNSYLNLTPVFQDIGNTVAKTVEMNLTSESRTGYSPFTSTFNLNIMLDQDIDTLNTYYLSEVHVYPNYTSAVPGTYETISVPFIAQPVASADKLATLNAITFAMDFSGYKGKTYDIGVSGLFNKYSDNQALTTDINVLYNMIICGFSPKEQLPVYCEHDFLTRKY